MKEIEKLTKVLECIRETNKDKWDITYNIKVRNIKKCCKCNNTEKECPDFYKTSDTMKDICGDCYGIQRE